MIRNRSRYICILYVNYFGDYFKVGDIYYVTDFMDEDTGEYVAFIIDNNDTYHHFDDISKYFISMEERRDDRISSLLGL